ncbi:cytoplasmic protein [Bacillus pseudomycoides]|nr:cytoplasmic protein [Bacillus pseudomycoides]
MKDRMETVLPLGSVVRLSSDENADYVITTRGVLLEDKTFYDYGGVLHPLGLTGETYKLFNHSDIVQVQFEGYRNKIEGQFAAKFKIWRNEFVEKVIETKKKEQTDQVAETKE